MAIAKYSKVNKYLPPSINTTMAEAIDQGAGGSTENIPAPKTFDENTTKLLILAVILFALIFLFK